MLLDFTELSSYLPLVSSFAFGNVSRGRRRELGYRHLDCRLVVPLRDDDGELDGGDAVLAGVEGGDLRARARRGRAAPLADRLSGEAHCPFLDDPAEP